jgi:cysteine synthase A
VTSLAFDEAAAAYQTPRLVRLGANLYGVCFTLMKLVPARFILRKALRDGQLDPGTVIVETTSGTFGLALAMQAAHLRRRLILVSDPVIDERLLRRLTDLGAEVQRVPASAGSRPGGFQAARMSRLAEIRAGQPASFCPEQYSNPDNPLSYAAVALLLTENLGPVDCLVGSVGSGGSVCGITAGLRASSGDCQAIAVDTYGSVLFGHTEGPRELRGLGMSILPANLDHRLVDSVHWCTATAAYAATRQLHRQHALFMGPTSGAAYLVARWWAAAHPDALTVAIFPDEGHRYVDTVYDDQWLAERGHLGVPLPAEPVIVADPAVPAGEWAAYPWARRSFHDVIARTSAETR